MPGISYGGQEKQTKRSGRWIIPIVLIVIAILLITVSSRVGNGGVLGVMRSAVQTITNPLTSLCSGVAAPFSNIGQKSSYTDEQIRQIIEENKQLKTLVAELEEYRQQDQRLTGLLSLSDTYGLEHVAGKIVGKQSGWNRICTINIGSDKGVQVGQGVLSSCGLYGQVESVTANSATVRMITDATSKVSAMVQSTRATGIVSGSYDGTMVLDYVPVDTTVGVGDVILTSGEGGVYPRGIIIGTAKYIETDSSKLYYRITVEPILNFNSCEEVLVLTGKETQVANLLNTDMINSIKNSSSIISAGSKTNQNNNSSNNSSSSNNSNSNSTSSDTNQESQNTSNNSGTNSGSSAETSSANKASSGFNAG